MRTIIVCFASEPWDGLWQRHHHLMSRLARRGHRIIYVDPTNLSEAVKRPGLLKDRIEEVEDNITVVRPLFLPLHYKVAPFDRVDALRTYGILRRALRRLDTSEPDIIMISSPFHSFLLRMFGNVPLLYDCVDASEGLCPTEETRQWYIQREKEILGSADAAIAVSRPLLERCLSLNERSYLVTNGASPLLSSGDRPEDLAALGRPLVGFVGRIGRWVDVCLLRDLAIGRPDCSIVLIGPVDCRDEALPVLRKLSNVHFLGTKEFEAVAGYITNMDVCIIPFKVIPLTSMANPVKMFEYASLGIPIVSTPLEVVLEHSEVVYLSDGTSDSFIEQVGAALVESDPDLRERRKELSRRHDWDAITDQVESILVEVHGRRTEM